MYTLFSLILYGNYLTLGFKLIELNVFDMYIIYRLFLLSKVKESLYDTVQCLVIITNVVQLLEYAFQSLSNILPSFIEPTLLTLFLTELKLY